MQGLLIQFEFSEADGEIVKQQSRDKYELDESEMINVLEKLCNREQRI